MIGVITVILATIASPAMAQTAPGSAEAAASVTAEAPIALGRAVRAGLVPVAQVRFALPPEKAGAPETFGGLLAFDVPSGGRYRVALGAVAWIDLVRDGKALASVAHGHGPACSGIRKMVDFDLTPGRYVMQVSGAPERVIAVEIMSE